MRPNTENTAMPSKYYEAGRAVAIVAMFGLIYGYLMLSTDPDIPRIGFILLTLLQFARIILRYKTFSRLGLAFEIGLLAVLLVGIIGSYGWNLRTHPGYSSLLILVLICSRMKSLLFGIDS